MASTQQGRDQYREHIGGFYPRGTSYGKPYLKTGWKWSTVRYLAGGPYASKGYIDLPVHPAARDGMMALASVFYSYGYSFDESAGGTVSMRNITGAKQAAIEKQVRYQYPYATSIHAHGCCIDINPSRNPYGPGTDELDRKIEIVQAAKRIVTVQGFPIVRWGGDWSNDDDMHFEVINCTRVQLEKGINWQTVRGWPEYLAWIGGGPGPVVPDLGDDAMWTKPGDPVANLADAQAVFAYQGSAVFSPSDFAYDENDARNLDERMKVLMARITNILMIHDERIRKEEAEAGGAGGAIDSEARTAASNASKQAATALGVATAADARSKTNEGRLNNLRQI